MGEDLSSRPVRLMNFVSEEQLEESKQSRGERVEDGTSQRDRPLFEILRENKDKRDAEFNERFKHRPPKALDPDESEFLDSLEQSRRDYERRMADDDAQQLRTFQAAQSTVDLKEVPPIPLQQVAKPKKAAMGVIISVKPSQPEAKKPKLDHTHSLPLVSYSDDSDQDD